MNLGFGKETAKASAEFDPTAEFREGVKLLKDEYPQKALIRLRRAFEPTSITPLSFVPRIVDARAAQVGSPTEL
jgi:hypothetical protein